MNFQCNDCGRYISEENLGEYQEDRGIKEPPERMYETFSCCPGCGSIDLTPAVKCTRCGEWFSEDDYKVFAGFCKECTCEEMAEDNELFQRYLKDYKAEADFYIYYLHESDPKGVSDSLLQLAREDFERKLNSRLTEEDAREQIKEFISVDDWALAAETIETVKGG